MRILKLLPVALAVVTGLAAVQWLRERYGRGGPIPVSQAQMLLSPARRLIMPVRRTLERFGLRPGETVLELGPGPGYYSIEACRMVSPGGRLLCLDLQPGMLEILRGRLDERGASGVSMLAADAMHLPLADESVDRAFLVTVLGEVPDARAALGELRRVLRPGGTLGFSESFGDPDYVLQGKLRKMCREAGFEETLRARDFFGYTMCFRRG